MQQPCLHREICDPRQGSSAESDSAIAVYSDVSMSRATTLLLEQTPGERFREGWERRIIHTSQLMTVVIDVNNGPWTEADPLHSHPHEQITYVADGEILFLSEGDEPRRLSAGDLFAVPPNKPHSIQLLSKSARLVDSFTPLREDFLR